MVRDSILPWPHVGLSTPSASGAASRGTQPYQGGETTDGRRCYVGNINYDVREEEVRSAFNEFGQITKMSYKQGYAFIDFADKRDAEDAIASMNGKSLGSRTITVELSGRPPRGEKPRPREDDRSDVRGTFGNTGGGNSRSLGSSDTATRNLFVANIPEHLTEADVQQHFAKFGSVTTVKFLPQKSDTRAAFVDFDNVDDAREAYESNNMIGNSKLRTDYNRRKPPPSAEGGYGGDRDPPPPSYAERPRYDRYDERPRYEERRYDDRGPPPRYEERDRYADYPPPRGYSDRYDERRPMPERERERDYYERPRYDDRPQRYDDRPAPRYDDRPPPRYDDRPQRYEERPQRYEERPPPRYEERYREPEPRYDRGGPPPRYDDRPPPSRYDDDFRGISEVGR